MPKQIFTKRTEEENGFTLIEALIAAVTVGGLAAMFASLGFQLADSAESVALKQTLTSAVSLIATEQLTTNDFQLVSGACDEPLIDTLNLGVELPSESLCVRAQSLVNGFSVTVSDAKSNAVISYDSSSGTYLTK